MEDNSNNERKDGLPVSLIGCADAERLSGERRARGGGAGPAAGRPEQSGPWASSDCLAQAIFIHLANVI